MIPQTKKKNVSLYQTITHKLLNKKKEKRKKCILFLIKYEAGNKNKSRTNKTMLRRFNNNQILLVASSLSNPTRFASTSTSTETKKSPSFSAKKYYPKRTPVDDDDEKQKLLLMKEQHDPDYPNCETVLDANHNKYLYSPDGPGGYQVDYDAEYSKEFSNWAMLYQLLFVCCLGFVAWKLGDFVTSLLPHGAAAGSENNKVGNVPSIWERVLGGKKDKKDEIPVE